MTHKQVDIDQETIKEIIESLSQYLQSNYIFPEIAEDICSGLESHLKDGVYTDISKGEFLAFALTEQIQEENQVSG